MTDYDQIGFREDVPHGTDADGASSVTGQPEGHRLRPLPHPAIILDDSPQLRTVIEELEAGTYPQPEDAIWRDDLPQKLAIRLARATGATSQQIAAAGGEPPGKEKTVMAQQPNSYTFDIIAVTTVNVRAETEDQARAMIDGLTSITTRTTGDDIEAAAGLDVSTSDYDVVNVSPRGRGYLVSAETQGGEEISVSALELIPEPIVTADLAGLREDLAEADRALAGDSNDAEHDALYGLAEGVRGLLDESGHWQAGDLSPAMLPGLDFPHLPTASTPASPAQPAASGTATPAARTATQTSRRARGR